LHRLSLRFCSGLLELRLDHHSDQALARHVGFRRIRLQGGKQRGGQAWLMETS
jgi:hypothetical protein